MKTKILHILHSLRIGGLENGVVNLVNHLDPNRFDHVLCCIDTSGPMAERLTMPTEIYSLNKGNSRNYLLPFKIAKVIKRVNPDIVHTRNWGSIDGVIGARISGVKRVVHGEHGREVTDPDGTNKVRKRVRKSLNPWITKFVAVSSNLKDWLIEDIGIPEEKVIQIVNGVNIDQFKPPEDKNPLKERIGFGADSFVIGTVGRLDPVKDQETLIRAFSHALNGSERKYLLIVGSGPDEQRLKTLVEDAGIMNKVFFIREQTGISEWMQAMDVFVLPSIAEGISNTILEAMASGLPVVATMVGGNYELVEHGRTGFLFAPGDSMELSKRLSLYTRNSSILKEHGDNGRSRVEKMFSLSKMIKKYEELYESL